MSDTPRTDAAYFKQGATMYDLAQESKKLERELAGAKEDSWSYHFRRRALEAEAELADIKADFEKLALSAAQTADRNVELRCRAERAEAALSAEREKVRVLRDSMTRLEGYCSWVITPTDRICAIACAALAATKEASK
jgi:hypothetical protein